MSNAYGCVCVSQKLCLCISEVADNQLCSTGIIFAVYLIVRCAGLPTSLCLIGSTSQNPPNTLAA